MGDEWVAAVEKELGAHTEGASISDLDGIHTLTCALMLLNTDLHGHVSWGGRTGVCSLTDFTGCPRASPFSSLLPETSRLLAHISLADLGVRPLGF